MFIMINLGLIGSSFWKPIIQLKDSLILKGKKWEQESYNKLDIIKFFLCNILKRKKDEDDIKLQIDFNFC